MFSPLFDQRQELQLLYHESNVCVCMCVFLRTLKFLLIVCQNTFIYIYIYKCPTRCNTAQYIFFISLQNYSTCFGCLLHPSSGVQETVVADHWYKSCFHFSLAFISSHNIMETLQNKTRNTDKRALRDQHKYGDLFKL
jgi:hypothetical protein